MKRTNSVLAVIAGLLMTVIGSAAYAAAAPCPPAAGYTDSTMRSNMPAIDDNSAWFDELSNSG